MPWNSNGPGQGPGQGPGPWGVPPSGGGPRRPNGGGPPPRGPWPPGMPPVPDLDAAIAAAQAWVRRLLPGGGMGGRGPLIGVIVLLAIWLGTGFYRVQPDEQGVVLRFGAFTRTTPPGLNYHLPWPVESVMVPAVTRINRIDIGYRSAPMDMRQANGSDIPVQQVQQESMMLTGDENIIDINFAVFWHISNAGEFLFSTRNPAQTVKSAAESVMREVIGSTPIQPALAEARARIEAAVLSGTQAILTQYKPAWK